MPSLRLLDLKACEAGLKHLINSDLPVNAAYTIQTSISQVSEQLKRLETFTKEVLQKYGKPKDGYLVIERDDEVYEKAMDEIAVFLETPVDIQFTPTRLSDLGTKAEIKPVLLKALIDTGFIIE